MITFDNYDENVRILGDYQIVRLPNYGFWEVQDRKGKPVKGLDMFTTAQMAGRELKNLLSRKK